jgi:hypothetical protein
MTQSEILHALQDLNGLVLQGKSLEAFEKYYHDQVVMQENENPPTVGKEANRQRELAFYGSVTEFRGAKPLKVTAGDNYSMVEWHYDYTHKDWGVKNYTQVSVQEWQDGKIKKEKFYYSNN